MDQETLKALTRIGEIEAELTTMDARRTELNSELSRLHDSVRAAGWTRTRPRKAKAEPAKKRGAKEVQS